MKVQATILAVAQLCNRLAQQATCRNGTKVRLNAEETEQTSIQWALASSSKLCWEDRGLASTAISQAQFKVFFMAKILASSSNGIQPISVTNVLQEMESTPGLRR